MNMNVTLTDEQASFVEVKVLSGQYTSSSEVVREALRLLEKQDAEEQQKLFWLRDAWRDGVSSGDARELDVAEIKRQGRDLLARAEV